MLKSLLLQNIMEEKVQELFAELQLKKEIISNQPLLYKNITDLKLENVSVTS